MSISARDVVLAASTVLALPVAFHLTSFAAPGDTEPGRLPTIREELATGYQAGR